MPGIRKEIPKEETKNKYGGAARKSKLKQLGNMWLSYGYFLGNPGRGSLIEGRFAYTMKHKPIAAGH